MKHSENGNTTCQVCGNIWQTPYAAYSCCNKNRETIDSSINEHIEAMKEKRAERLEIAAKILAGSIVVEGVGEALFWADRLIKEIDK